MLNAGTRRQCRSSRSREGAWIEIVAAICDSVVNMVAPARERGLKSGTGYRLMGKEPRRSREGAWIEIRLRRQRKRLDQRRSREGAWIEIDMNSLDKSYDNVAPARERGLK